MHSEVYLDNSHYYIKDLGSSNGTYVNGEKITTHELKAGDIISIAPKEFIFRDPQHDMSQDVFTEGVDEIDGKQFNMTTMKGVPSSSAVSKQAAEPEALQDKRDFYILIESIQAFSLSDNIDNVLNNILKKVLTIVPAHNAAIFQRDERGILSLKAHIKREGAQSEFSYSKSIIRKAAKEKQAVLIVDTGQSEGLNQEASIINYNIKSAMCSPLIYHNELLGIMYLDTQGEIKNFNQDMLHLLTGISSAAAATIHNSIMMQENKIQAET